MSKEILHKSLTQSQIKNLLIFLDRVEVKGLKEAHALMEIVGSLSQSSIGDINKKEGEE